MNNITTEKNPLKGIIYCLLTYFCVALISTFEKAASHAVALPDILFSQNLICFLILLPQVIKGGVSELKTSHYHTYAIRIISGLGCYAILFYLIRFMPMTEAMIYQYSASLWIPFIMLIWFNTKMPSNLWYGILIGFFGIILILNPTASHLGLISLFGIACGICQGLSVVAVRKLALTEPITRILFYYFLFCIILTSPLSIKDWSPLGFEDYILLLCLGISTYLTQTFFALSLQYANATTLAPICYTSLLFSGVLGWVFWREVPTPLALLGMLLVVIGCLVSIYMHHRNTTKMRDEIAALENA